MASTSKGSSAVSAAPISVPSSIVPGFLKRNLHLHREPLAGLSHRFEHADDGDLGLEQILRGFDQQNVDAAFDERGGLLFEGLRPWRRSRCAASDGSFVVGPIDPATKRGLSLVENCCATSFASCAALTLISRTRSSEIELRQNDGGTAEGVGLDDVAAHAEEVGVDVTNDVGAAEHQNFAAIFLAPVIIQSGIARLDVGAHRAVVDDDTFLHDL